MKAPLLRIFLPFFLLLGCNGGGGTAVLSQQGGVPPGQESGSSSGESENRTAEVPWGAMYIPPDEFDDYPVTGTVVRFSTYSESTILNYLRKAEENNVKLIVTLGPTNPCDYLNSTEGTDTQDTCGFSQPHQLGRLDVNAVKQALQEFVAHADVFREYIEKGVIVGFRIFDEPHDRNCDGMIVTFSPQDMDEIYLYVRENFSNASVGSTSPPCYMKRTTHGNISFAQYRWPSSKSLEDFFREHMEEAREANLLLVASLNSNYSDIDNSTFFRGFLTLCRLKPFFITSWQWPTVDRYPYLGVEDRIKDPEIQDLIDQIVRECGEENR